MTGLKPAAAAACLAALAAFAAPAIGAEGWTPEPVTGPSPFHGIHGITVTPSGRMLAGSVVGRTLYEIDRKTGEVSVHEGPPYGMADDVEEGPDGTLAWTAFLDGKVYTRKPGGEIVTVAEGLPGTNSLAWTDDGRLFMTQVFAGDALWELDPTGENPPREIMKDMGGLNGFDFGPDGKLYGPLWFKAQVARVDVDTGTLEVVAEGFNTPAAANFNSKGELYVVDTGAGEVIRVDPASSEKTVVAKVKPAIDNLAFSPEDDLYITNMADNAVIKVDVETGESEALVSGPLAAAGDIALSEDGQSIYVADVFAIRKVSVTDGTVSEVARVFSSDIDYPLGVAVGAGRIGFAGLTAGAVQIMTKDETSEGTHHGFTTPMDALPQPDGSFLITEYARGTIARVEHEGWGDRADIVEGLEGPASLVRGPDNALYVSEHAAGRISRLTDSGGTEIVVDGLDGPEGFDFAPDGRIVVAEVGAKRITAIDPATGEREVLAENLPIGFEGPAEAPPIFIPTGIAVTPDGDVYFSSDVEARLYVLHKN